MTAKLAQRIERVAIAIARLDASISNSCMRKPWQRRAAWSGYTKALQGQGAEIDEIDIFGKQCGIMIPGRENVPSLFDDLDLLSVWQTDLEAGGARHWREIIHYPTALPPDWGDRPALLRALQILAFDARQNPSIRSPLKLPRLLQALDICQSALPCLVISDRAWRLAPNDRDAIVARFLKQLRNAAETGARRLRLMETERVRAAAAIEDMSRPGRLPSILAMAQQEPVLTPKGVANRLRLTISGAGKLLARASTLGLLVEITGRAAWKIYLPHDLAVEFGFAERPQGRPPSPTSRRAPLDETLSRFDREMQEIDARLSRLGLPQHADDNLDESDPYSDVDDSDESEAPGWV